MSGALQTDELAAGIFFIVGAPRSGTTLLQAMLSSHSRIFIPPETEFFMSFEPPGSEAPSRVWDEYWQRIRASRKWRDQGVDLDEFKRRCDTTDQSSRAVFLELLQMHAERAGKPRAGEKSPHHYRHTKRIREVFPSARFVNIIRDPRDVVASRMRTPWSRGGVADHARSWRRAIEAHERNAASLPAAAYRSVRFEDLVGEPEGTLRSICEFLGEEFEAPMLEFHDRKQAGFSDREQDWKGNTFKPLSAAAVGRHKETLSPRQVDIIQRITSSQMREFCYDLDVIARRPSWALVSGVERLLGK